MSEWIRCSEREPDEGDHVIICVYTYNQMDKGRHVLPSTFHDGNYYEFTEEDDEVFVGDKRVLHPPTHWMPLPQPPTA